ncbi:MAG: IS1595 family transposase [Desulfobaccales bacterium]
MDITEIFELYPTQADCILHLEDVRWQGKPRCPYCQSMNVTPAPKEQRHHCNNCNTTFSVTVGTIFHHTHLPCQKWFLAVTLVLNAKKGLSSRQLARDLHVNKDTAWRMGMKIREAMREQDQRELLTGLVEMDEAYIGGKPRKGDSGDKPKRGRGTKKTPVVGMIERGGKVRAKVMKKGSLTAKKLTSLVRRNVDIANATLITDEYKGYLGIKHIMPHKTIDHSFWYVNGDIHTNNIESFWAILKRGIVGQYHKVSLRYLPKYIDEFSYRFNNRHHDDLFGQTINRAVGVR